MTTILIVILALKGEVLADFAVLPNPEVCRQAAEIVVQRLPQDVMVEGRAIVACAPLRTERDL